MTNSKGGFTLSKTNKKLLKETHLNTVLMESYKPEDKTVEGSPVIASFKINVTTENLENHNGRVYSTEVWNQPYALQRGGKYLDESGKLRPLSLLGNLDHPKDNHGEVYLSEAGLAWYQLEKQGLDWLGEAHVLDTPQGKIIKTFLEYAKQFGGGDQIGVSTRALGDAIMVESVNGPVEEIVPEGFELVSVDFVYSPSSIYSNTPLMESKHRNKNILVESIQGLRAQDLEHKEIYDTVLKELDPEIQEIKKGLEHMDINKLFEATKAVKFSHAVIEFIEGGPNYDTPTQKILRNHRNSGTKFTDLDKLFDLVYKADQEYDTEQGGYDKCYIDFYGSVGGDAIKLLHIRYDIGDKLGREEYPMNKDLDELEDIMIDKVWNTYKTTQGLKENKFVKSETVTINKAKADYLKQLKDTEYKLHHAIYTIDNMGDDEYKQTKYFVDTPERQKFLNKLKKEHDAVVAEINAAESLTENKGENMDKTKDELKENNVVLEADETEDLDKDETELETDVDNAEADETETDEETDKETDEDTEDSEDEETEKESESEKLDRILTILDDLTLRIDGLFAPLTPIEQEGEDDFEDEENEGDENEGDEATDFSDEDIDTMTEEELLSLEELLELE